MEGKIHQEQFRKAMSRNNRRKRSQSVLENVDKRKMKTQDNLLFPWDFLFLSSLLGWRNQVSLFLCRARAWFNWGAPNNPPRRTATHDTKSRNTSVLPPWCRAIPSPLQGIRQYHSVPHATTLCSMQFWGLPPPSHMIQAVYVLAARPTANNLGRRIPSSSIPNPQKSRRKV